MGGWSLQHGLIDAESLLQTDPYGSSRTFWKEVGLGYNLLSFGGLSTFSDSVWIHRGFVLKMTRCKTVGFVCRGPGNCSDKSSDASSQVSPTIHCPLQTLFSDFRSIAQWSDGQCDNHLQLGPPLFRFVCLLILRGKRALDFDCPTLNLAL